MYLLKCCRPGIPQKAVTCKFNSADTENSDEAWINENEKSWNERGQFNSQNAARKALSLRRMEPNGRPGLGPTGTPKFPKKRLKKSPRGGGGAGPAPARGLQGHWPAENWEIAIPAWPLGGQLGRARGASSWFYFQFPGEKIGHRASRMPSTAARPGEIISLYWDKGILFRTFFIIIIPGPPFLLK